VAASYTGEHLKPKLVRAPARRTLVAKSA